VLDLAGDLLMLFGLVSERENARSSCRILKSKLVLCVQEVLLISVEHSDVAACSKPGKDNVPHARWILLTRLLLCMFRIYITHRIISVLSQQSEKLFVVIKKENIASGGILLQTEIIRIYKRLFYPCGTAFRKILYNSGTSTYI